MSAWPKHPGPDGAMPLLEAADPASDGRAFRRCLAQFATGVTVMTTCHDGELAGLTVNSFSSLSLDPPLVLWSIRRQSTSLPLFRQAGHFAVNVLAADQVAVSNLFAGSASDRFGQVRWRSGQGGAPLLDGVIATMECTLEQVHDGGDHFILIGRVRHCERFHGEPLLFTQGGYAVTREYPETVESAPPTPPPIGDAAEGSLMRLLHYASHQMTAGFDEEREAAGLTVAQFRVYGWLRTQPRTLEQLKQLAYLGGRDTDDTVAELLESGQLVRAPDGLLSLTEAGRNRAEDVARRLAAFEARLFTNLRPADIATARQVLATAAHRAMEG